MKKYKSIILILLLILSLTGVFAAGDISYAKIRKYYLPEDIYPEFINDLSNCTESYTENWEGTYRYVILGKDTLHGCRYKVQYNPWLEIEENEWKDIKYCRFSDGQLFELTQALKNYDKKINTYELGHYKITSTKLDYLLQTYEYYGTCITKKL